jgi:hypothetical protein
MAKFGDSVTTTDMPTAGTNLLSGNGPPADALGAVGDYYLDATAQYLYGPRAAAAVYGATQYPVGFISPASYGYWGIGTWGLQFHTNQPGRVMSLKYWRQNAQIPPYTTTLLLFRQSDQTEIARVTKNYTGSEPPTWDIIDLATPLSIPAGYYRVGYSLSVTMNSQPYTVSYLPSSTASGVAIDGNCTVNTRNTYPGVADTTCYFVDIAYQVATTPIWPVALKSAP